MQRRGRGMTTGHGEKQVPRGLTALWAWVEGRVCSYLVTTIDAAVQARALTLPLNSELSTSVPASHLLSAPSGSWNLLLSAPLRPRGSAPVLGGAGSAHPRSHRADPCLFVDPDPESSKDQVCSLVMEESSCSHASWHFVPDRWVLVWRAFRSQSLQTACRCALWEEGGLGRRRRSGESA